MYPTTPLGSIWHPFAVAYTVPMIERISDINDPRLRIYSGLTDGQLARGEYLGPDLACGVMVAESQRVALRALDAGAVPVSLFVEQRWLEHDRAVIERIEQVAPDAPIFVATHEQFAELTGYQVTRGSLAAFARPPLASVEEVVADARRVAVIEDVTNYANMGSLFRSAAALGIDAVLVTPSCHDPFYRRCARVSMGAVFQVPWTRIGTHQEWAPTGVPLLKKLGFTCAAMALVDGAHGLDCPELTSAERVALVLGTEGEGLQQATIDACDLAVRIPMEHEVDSLNVAVAAAIAFWELRRTRGC